jgi:hypothetical protein
VAIVDAVTERRPDAPRPGAQRRCRWSPPARAWRSACRQNFGIGLASPQASALPPGHRAAARSSRAAARWPPTGRSPHFIATGRPAAGDRPAADRVGRSTWRPRRCLGRALAGVGRWPGAGLFHGRNRRREIGAGATRRRAAGAMVERTASPPSRAAWSNAACASSSWPAARPRAPACRRWASRRCRSARRSTPACRGAMPSSGRSRRWRAALHLTLKSGNFGTDDFFTKAFKAARMNDDASPRRNLPRRQAACSSAATCTPRPATSACASDSAGRRLPHHADRRLPGLPRPGAAGRRRCATGVQTGGDRASKTLALHRRIYAAAHSVRHGHGAASSTRTARTASR